VQPGQHVADVAQRIVCAHFQRPLSAPAATASVHCTAQAVAKTNPVRASLKARSTAPRRKLAISSRQNLRAVSCKSSGAASAPEDGRAVGQGGQGGAQVAGALELAAGENLALGTQPLLHSAQLGSEEL
jgi:hypothetical protein